MMTNRLNIGYIALPTIIALMEAAIPSAALAQYSIWNLTVNAIDVPQQTDQINIDVYGPFASSPIQHQVIHGPNTSYTFSQTAIRSPQITHTRYAHQPQPWDISSKIVKHIRMDNPTPCPWILCQAR
jgi:hypothetical protein